MRISASSASGKIALDCMDESDAEVNTVSGTVMLCLLADLDFAVEIDTASGNFESEFALKKRGNTYICRNSLGSFDIETDSEDVRIIEKDNISSHLQFLIRAGAFQLIRGR